MAGSLNRVFLIGRLGQDPKLTYLPSGQAVAEFSLATDESYKNREGQKVEQTEWHRVKVFGRSAEFCGNYLSKGRLVYVEGSLKTRSWEDQQGQKRYVTEVVVSGPQGRVQALERGKDDQGQGGDYRSDPGAFSRKTDTGGGRHRQGEEQGRFPGEATGMDSVPF